MADRNAPPPPPGGHDSRPFLPQPAPSSSVGPVSSAPSPLTPGMSSQNIMNMTVERAIQNSQVQSSAVSRMSRVIEDSVRKDPGQEKKSIYAPNSRGTPVTVGQAGEVVLEGLAVPRDAGDSLGKFLDLQRCLVDRSASKALLNQGRRRLQLRVAGTLVRVTDDGERKEGLVDGLVESITGRVMLAELTVENGVAQSRLKRILMEVQAQAPHKLLARKIPEREGLGVPVQA